MNLPMNDHTEVERLRRHLADSDKIRHEVEQVLDEALGTEVEDGAGAGLVADVALLANRLKIALWLHAESEWKFGQRAKQSNAFGNNVAEQIGKLRDELAKARAAQPGTVRLPEDWRMQIGAVPPVTESTTIALIESWIRESRPVPAEAGDSTADETAWQPRIGEMATGTRADGPGDVVTGYYQGDSKFAGESALKVDGNPWVAVHTASLRPASSVRGTAPAPRVWRDDMGCYWDEEPDGRVRLRVPAHYTAELVLPLAEATEHYALTEVLVQTAPGGPA